MTAHRQHAFTLTELLVTLTVIALLIAILLPALAGARSAAQLTQCLSNLRQLGIAHESYLHDGDEWFIYRMLPATEYQWRYVGRSNVPYGGGSQQRPLNPYLQYRLKGETHAPLARCTRDRPILPLIAGGSSPSNNLPMAEFFGTSYLMSMSVLNHTPAVPSPVNPLTYPPVRLSHVSAPFDRVILTGEAHWFYIVRGIDWEADAHNLGDAAPITFLDGHAGITPLERGQAHTDRYLFGIKNPTFTALTSP